MALKVLLILSFVALAFCRVDHQSWKRAESSDNDLEIFQTPECHAENGVCAPIDNCHNDFLHPAEDLCDRNNGVRCCLTTTFKSKNVIQMPSCAALKSTCTWNHLCEEKDRHDDTTLCGSQYYVSCCKNEEEPIIETYKSKRVPTVADTRPLCFAEGGMCIIVGECDDIIHEEGGQKLCQPNAKCCRPKNHRLQRTIDIDEVAPVKRDEEYIPISEKRNNVEDTLAHFGLNPGQVRELGSKCGRGGECRTIEECGNGFTDNSADCGQSDLICCVITRKKSNE